MKEKRDQTLSVAITETMKKQLEELAEQHEWTISQTCYVILREYLASANGASAPLVDKRG